MASVEVLHPDMVITPDERDIAQSIGLGPAGHNEIMHTEMHDLGDIKLYGEDPHRALRILCGPEGTVHQGGTKFKPYGGDPSRHRQDTVDHGAAMTYKIGGINEINFGGGKTVVDIDPNPPGMTAGDRQARRAEALDQLAGLTDESGLADPRRNGTAGDEGTNGDIGIHYLGGLQRRGVLHAEACVTGKPDMATRPGATGRGAAIVHRALMRLMRETDAGVVIQGAGFAGAYYAAEAYAPLDGQDNDVRIAPLALGDVRRIKIGKDVHHVPVTLLTDHPDGLPITKEMVDAILLDPNDPDMIELGFDKLAALSAKIGRSTGVNTRIVEKDVLTYDGGGHSNMYLAPAATSNVLRPDNIGEVKIRRVVEIGNHTVSADLLPRLGSLGIWLAPGELVNAGGVKISLDEKRRDLSRIAAAEGVGLHIPTTDAQYQERLRDTMVSTTHRAHRVSCEYGVPLAQALKMVSLANYAIAYSKGLSPRMRSIVAG